MAEQGSDNPNTDASVAELARQLPSGPRGWRARRWRGEAISSSKADVETAKARAQEGRR